MSKKELPKVDLTLLKKLVSELEIAVNNHSNLPTSSKEEVHNFITEVAKSTGIAAAVAQEAGALVKDMYRLSAIVQQPTTSMDSDASALLAEIFGGAPMFDDPEKKNRN